jgi:hypothetical protein
VVASVKPLISVVIRNVRRAIVICISLGGG